MSEIDKIYINNGICNIASGDHYFSFSDIRSPDVVVNNEVNSTTDLFIDGIRDLKTLTFNVNENSALNLSFLFRRQIDPLKITINVKSNSVVNVYFAEFSVNELSLDCVINLLEENASAYVKLASLSSQNDDKTISVSINHVSPKTYGKVDNYGVCKDNGKLLFSGTSHIFENAIKSKTQQNAKIMVFDEASNAIAKPILKIDENDIEASHAAVVGKINDEHLFYLTSRGISEADAKQLITLGYLKPILEGFKNESARNIISSLIEGRM